MCRFHGKNDAMIQRSRASRAEAVRTRRVLDALGTGVIVRDASSTIVDWNTATLRTLDLTDAQLLGDEKRAAGWRLFADEGPPFPVAGDVLHAALDRAAETGRTTVRILAGDRAAAWIAILANVEPDAVRGGALETTYTLTDITEQRTAERENERYREIIDALDASHRILEESPVAICSVDMDGGILRSNMAFLGLAGIDSHSIFSLVPREDHAALREAFVSLMDGRTTSVRRETRLVRSSGASLWCEITAVAMRQGLSDAAILLLVSDVTEWHEREVRLRKLAERDPLTGVHNRRSFVDVLTESLRRLRSHGRRAATDHALLLIDLDGFKHVNDTCGHAGGDAVLVAVAAGIRERTRAADTVGRLGGDEFVALLELRDAASAAAIAQEIIDRVKEAALSVPGAPPVSASIGIVHLSPTCSAQKTLALADRAMYEAKRTGKARFVDAGACTTDEATREHPSPPGAIAS
jgi:diguanylate cyclase (GGDEF)-like protein/PAS domain S-box-containing protein